MGFQLERKRFNDDWRLIVLFLAMVTIPTFWTLLDVQTSLGGSYRDECREHSHRRHRMVVPPA